MVFPRKFWLAQKLQVFKKAFYVSSGTFRRKNFGWNQIISNFGHWARKRRFLGETVLAELSTSHCMYPEQHFWTKSVYSQRTCFSLSFLLLSEELPVFRQTITTTVSKPRVKWPEELFEKISFGWRYNFIYFQGSSEGSLTGKKTPGPSGRHSTCTVEHSEEQISGGNKTFLTLLLWAKIFRVSGEKVDRVATTALHVTTEAPGVKWTFS